jgi:hypothetical protein
MQWQVLRLGRWLERCPLYVAGLNPFRVINLLGERTSASGVGGYRAEDPARLPLLLENRPSCSVLYRSSHVGRKYRFSGPRW